MIWDFILNIDHGGNLKNSMRIKCTVKLIYVNPLSRLSLQYHKKRSEFWMVVTGIAHVKLTTDSTCLRKGKPLKFEEYKTQN